MAKKKDKTLTTRFSLDVMADFSAAVEILGARSINAMVHQMVMEKIREAKQLVSEEEFQKVVEEKIESIEKRSKMKSKERLEMIGEILPKGKKTIKVITQPAHVENKKKAS